MFQIPPHIKLYATLKLRRSAVVNHTEFRNLFGILVYKRMKLDIHKQAKIELKKGRLELGRSWVKNNPFAGLLKMGKHARIIVNGSFTIFDRAVIFVNDGAILKLGDNSYINSNASIHCFKEITIGNNVVISEGVSIRDSDNHILKGASSPMLGRIEIKDNVWVGLNVTILKGVTVGEGSVIAAGAVVTTDVPSKSLVGGVPAKIIKSNVEWNR